jgi:hypothetical protein
MPKDNTQTQTRNHAQSKIEALKRILSIDDWNIIFVRTSLLPLLIDFFKMIYDFGEIIRKMIKIWSAVTVHKLCVISQSRMRRCVPLLRSSIKLNVCMCHIYIFRHFHRIFLDDFWRKILRIFVRKTSPGSPLAALETLTSAISHVLGGPYPPTVL